MKFSVEIQGMSSVLQATFYKKETDLLIVSKIQIQISFSVEKYMYLINVEPVEGKCHS